MDQALQTFIGESRELLEEMEQSLLSLGATTEPGEDIHAIFRAAHTIKGSAGLFGLDGVVAFTHIVESLLDQLRSGEQAWSEDMAGLLLSARDHIVALIEAVAAGEEPSTPVLQQGAKLATALSACMQGAVAEVADQALAAQADAASTPDAEDGHWHISLRFHADTLRHGMDPLSFLFYLRNLGQIVHVETVADALPLDGSFDAESCYLGFEIALRGQTDHAAIESVFEFVLDACELRILAPGSTAEQFAALADALPEGAARARQWLIACASLPAEAETSPTDARADALPAGGEVKGEVAALAASAPSPVQALPPKPLESRSVRVDADRLDQLIDQIGELIIASAGTSLAARQTRNPELQERSATLASLVQAVRESALQLRMVRIGATFNRFQRVVHDTARELGKDIGLIIRGEDTELDKTVVEKVADPITHLVRNAMDHGIESAEVRRQRGKSERGTITLEAWHDSGAIVIRVADDGGGLNRDKILAKAVDRGLVDAHRQLSDSEIYELIFEPGFSTAEQVSNLSGRGVGMDVVKRNITALRGSISIDSTPGQGTAISIRLPLTLAIIDGFLVEVGNATFVIPMDVIDECVEFSQVGHNDFANLRGQVLPLIGMHQVFGLGTGARSGRRNIVVIRHAGRSFGLVVDALLGEFQTVIKPLAKLFAGVRCVSGSTVLGNGKVALIVDVPALVDQAGQAALARASAASAAVSAA
nr:chemotaxis protein CheA [Oleiagrimonas sp. C23AA]